MAWGKRKHLTVIHNQLNETTGKMNEIIAQLNVVHSFVYEARGTQDATQAMVQRLLIKGEAPSDKPVAKATGRATARTYRAPKVDAPKAKTAKKSVKKAK